MILFSLIFFILTVFLGAVYFYLHAKPNYSKLVYYSDIVGRGLLLGCALFHFLPDSVRAFADYYQLPFFVFAFVLGALLIGQYLLHRKWAARTLNNTVDWSVVPERLLAYFIPLILMLMLSLHALTEGVVLGAQTAWASFSTFTFAVLLHKGSESVALVTSMQASPYKQSQRVSLLLLFALMTPMGLLLGQKMFVNLLTNQLIVGLFNALAAMTFIYISQRCQSQCLFRGVIFKPNTWTTRYCFYGALFTMAILALWF